MNTKLPSLLAASALAAFFGTVATVSRAAGEGDTPQIASAAPVGRPGALVAPRTDAPVRAESNQSSRGIAAAGTPAGTTVTLYSGEVHVLDIPNVTRIAVGNGGVLKAQVIDPGQVLLIGEGTGSTTLRMWGANGMQYTYEVSVHDNNAVNIARDVQDMLASEPGLKVTQFDGRVLIEGDYTRPETQRKLEAITKMFPQNVVSTVPDHKIQAPVAIEKMVYLDVRVVEVHKSALEQLGVRWTSPIGGPSASLSGSVIPIARHSWSAAFGVALNLTSMLDILEQNGDSWTLAEPRVSCKSGGDAKFVVGGEIPIAIPIGLGQTQVTYKQYGVILEFHPIADDKGNVSSKIIAEVSQPDQEFSGQGLIAFRENRTETQVSLHENETLVISGLLQNTGNRAVTGIPGVSDLPILGALFRSKQFQNDRTELIVMVTPRAASPESETSVAMAKQGDEKYNAVRSIISTKMAE